MTHKVMSTECTEPLLKACGVCDLCKHPQYLDTCFGPEVDVWRCGNCELHHECWPPVDGCDHRPGDDLCVRRDQS
jgi:hypothetical protein